VYIKTDCNRQQESKQQLPQPPQGQNRSCGAVATSCLGPYWASLSSTSRQ
jgi:hypothetical protein